ncbi:small subunit ribosomal protein S16e [Nematocida ausubeli]|uniref:30S ribosomal protein S9 n=1 Tax=Nematocida ausubeli (strain ATCC PRA-371 / ERTm2) TaxID=1913371 RepID=H8Z9G7_NEMA1|nr:30S ribosomal protein S9 [Nematocida ausubeli]EHY66598.1 30S ribosomal protein S9 [Nematocida ausubeli]KAI5133772.1 small subunit ribosomal protein S16e [Nematocida ausubeli]KAI5137122.1 small subunit ribosomal protein S16e [Nematocida ausubeli]KAI5149693.1 small subunit ribosomal protein S16e [Nematocida ausubeli]KAI5159436.1 small subunit ribosomal protein S16e [Nematocida ausubeli]
MSIQSITAKGAKKTAVAVSTCKNTGKFEIVVNKRPLHLFSPKMILSKVMELFTILDKKYYEGLSFNVEVRGGGDVTKLYAVRQALAKSLIAYYGKYVDEQLRADIKDVITKYDRYMVVADSRRKEPKKAGGPGARARYQKSFR